MALRLIPPNLIATYRAAVKLFLLLKDKTRHLWVTLCSLSKVSWYVISTISPDLMSLIKNSFFLKDLALYYFSTTVLMYCLGGMALCMGGMIRGNMTLGSSHPD